ncbi:ribonuclease H-like domain-containing protein [Tanacetum coccineum]
MTKWPTYTSDIDGFCNGGELPGMVRVGCMTYFQDHKWYDELADGENYSRGPYANTKTEKTYDPYLDINRIFGRNYGANNAGDTQDRQEHKKEHEGNKHTVSSKPTHDPSIYQVKRFEMIKYSFDADDEYVAIKEHEYFDHSRANIDSCQAYRELFCITNEGWLVTKAAKESIKSVRFAPTLWYTYKVLIFVILEFSKVIENGNSWVPIPVTAPESGPSTALKMTVPSTTEEKICKKNDVKARSLLLMALPNEHQLTFNQYVDAQSMFAAIKLQKLVSRLAILGVVTPPEDLNVKFLRSLPSEWDTHVVVWMNKPDFDTMGLDDLYNNFKIVEQKVKRSTGAINDEKNLAFLTTSVTTSFSDCHEFMLSGLHTPTRSQHFHEDLEQLHDDDLEEMDLKWNMALLSMRARKFYQRTGRKIIIDGSSTAGYDKSKVKCFNCHKMGHFTRGCRAPRSKDNRNWNQGSSSKAVRIEDASKGQCIQGVSESSTSSQQDQANQDCNCSANLEDASYLMMLSPRSVADCTNTTKLGS